MVTRYIVYFVAGLAMGQKYLLLTIDIIYGKQLMALKIAFSGPICPLLLTSYCIVLTIRTVGNISAKN